MKRFTALYKELAYFILAGKIAPGNERKQGRTMNKISGMIKGLLIATILMAPAVASAEAGKVMFVFGQAWVDSADGTRQEVSKDMTFDNGDQFVTSSDGRVQLRMADGGLIALRPSTQFVIEEFSYAGEDSDAGAASQPERSFFGLVKGGFRSITGAVGQKDKSAYRVRTPVATIGIRGTDYDAMFCETACEPGQAGLYVGVTEGGVVLTNSAGTLDLGPGQYGYVADEDSAPETSIDGADILASGTGTANSSDDNTEDADVSVAVTGTDDSGQSASLTEGEDVQAGQPGQVGFAAGPLATVGQFSGVTSGSSASLGTTDTGDLVNFSGAFPTDSQGNTTDVTYSIGSAQILDRGEDASAGLRWGRWANGTISVIDGSGVSSDQDLFDSSLHWVTGSVGQPTPVLPTTGSASFTLVGNTNPTDNSGNVGTLGSANLSADFNRQTVDADVSLSMDATNEIWNASAQDVAIDNADATFSDAFDNVSVTDTIDGSVIQGDGSLSGFFTGDESGNVTGAGLGYSLEDGQGTSVTGAAAFTADDPASGQ